MPSHKRSKARHSHPVKISSALGTVVIDRTALIAIRQVLAMSNWLGMTPNELINEFDIGELDTCPICELGDKRI